MSTSLCTCCHAPAVDRVVVGRDRGVISVCEECRRMMRGQPLSAYGVERAEENERNRQRRRRGGKGRFAQG